MFYFTSPQPIKPKEASDSDFTIGDVMLWPGMRFSLLSQCKRCSAGRLHVVHRLYNFSNATTVAHVQGRNKNGEKHLNNTTCTTINPNAKPVTYEATHVFDRRFILQIVFNFNNTRLRWPVKNSFVAHRLRNPVSRHGICWNSLWGIPKSNCLRMDYRANFSSGQQWTRWLQSVKQYDYQGNISTLQTDVES